MCSMDAEHELPMWLKQCVQGNEDALEVLAADALQTLAEVVLTAAEGSFVY